MNPVADVLIRVDEVALLPPVRRDLIELTVQDDLNMASAFSLKLHAWDDATRTVTWADLPQFGIGRTLEIMLGYLGDLQSVIKGEIVDMSCQFNAQAAPVLSVSGQDFRHRLGRSAQNESYQDMTDSQIARAVIGRNSLTFDVPESPSIRKAGTSVSQNNETDLAFLRRLAGSNGFELLITGKKVYFGPPRPQPTPLLLTLGSDQLTDFSAAISSNSVIKKVQVNGLDDQGNDIRSEAVATSFPGSMLFDNLNPQTIVSMAKPVATKPEADQQAKAELTAQQAALLTGSGTCRGNTALRAGGTVQIAGVGKRFSGLYRVTSVTHSYSSTGTFSTTFQVNGSLQQ